VGKQAGHRQPGKMGWPHGIDRFSKEKRGSD
jgi:hypothetical protein